MGGILEGKVALVIGGDVMGKADVAAMVARTAAAFERLDCHLLQGR